MANTLCDGADLAHALLEEAHPALHAVLETHPRGVDLRLYAVPLPLLVRAEALPDELSGPKGMLVGGRLGLPSKAVPELHELREVLLGRVLRYAQNHAAKESEVQHMIAY